MYNFAWANVCVDILPSWSIILVAAAAATAVLVIVSTTITPSLVVTTTIVAIVTSTVTHVWNKTTELYTSVFSGSYRQIKFYFVSISQVKQMTILKNIE